MKRRILSPVHTSRFFTKFIKALIGNRRFTVRYLGQPRVMLDNTLAKAVSKEGYEFYASGYNFKTNIRDVVFEKLNKHRTLACGG